MASGERRRAAREAFAVSKETNQAKLRCGRWLRLAVVGAALLRSTVVCTWGANEESPVTGSKFVGPQSCSSSSCHGGAGENKDQYLVWSKYDYHHARPYATLETARAEHIAAVLNLGDPTRSAACTVCHAPLQTVPADQLNPGVAVSDGVSCESCHGRAEQWLRGHTRHDWTHEDRVRAGMRDLKNIYVRANTCVACHQTLDNGVRHAGHPELLFDLDGQSATEPRHWRKSEDKPSAQIWLVGQAVALREMSWQLSQEKAADEQLSTRWSALVWLVQLAGRGESKWPQIESHPLAPTPDRLSEVQHWSDKFAKAVSECAWSEQLTRECLARLAKSSDAFADQKVPTSIQARRAERLVLALDRLATGCDPSTFAKLDAVLTQLFDDVQSLPDFDPPQFARHLQEFHASASGILETK